MPTVAELERLQALTSRLLAIGGKVRGERILAEDWNVLVGAMVELARAVLAEERSETAPPHEHPDQVGLAWLDPNLRAIVERGPLSDPVITQRLIQLEQAVERLNRRLEGSGEETAGLRDRLAEFQSRDLVREADITRLRRVAEGLSERRDEILDVRANLNRLQADLRTAAAAVARFTVNGQPIDVAGLLTRVTGLEALRDSLRQANGEILSAAALERRFAELTGTLVTEADLDQAIRDRIRQVPDDRLDAFRQELRGEIAVTLDDNRRLAAEDARGAVVAGLADVDARVASSVADALPGIRDSILSTARTESAAAIDAAAGALGARLAARIEEVRARASQDLAGGLDSLRTALAADIESAVATRLTAVASPLQSALQGLRADLERVAQTQSQQSATLADHGTRLARVQADEAAARESLRQAVLQQIDRAIADHDRAIRVAIADIARGVDAQVAAGLAQARAGIVQAAVDATSGAIRAELQAETTRIREELQRSTEARLEAIRAEMRASVRDEIRANADTVVRDSVRREINDANSLVRTVVTRTINDRLGPP